MKKEEIKIRGLSKTQVEQLANLAQKKGYASKNKYILYILNQAIEDAQMIGVKQYFQNVLAEMIETQKALLILVQQSNANVENLSKEASDMFRSYKKKLAYYVDDEDILKMED
ncbi:hypothetical protein CIRMBP1271_02092 [Enterococcus cecorum]|uniref:hypothetical protein n=1 Tax=Enterococcus cecorum TaxID=44008 RepID=UPI0022DC279A|nr:hypothetical protein [Enterococcus cecorum]CAI3255073.1 hypothetical protein CIRMBP1267_00056 [Enterococcus cecorum]CAI3385675.1 hypothetical protein CIRMBP1274_01404 [Enterococcus cecorum]CAI3442256.1 hypothetical protein CIRMBP1240_02080 [Enterococcus cecorum]CAI3442348.1 hypothetical protein CIRMBP1265_01994 [Enterococcus cecorum]CAI3448612.1 hypothetical protein CIRMBP1225_01976 [Enterococcus cecorum]